MFLVLPKITLLLSVRRKMETILEYCLEDKRFAISSHTQELAKTYISREIDGYIVICFITATKGVHGKNQLALSNQYNTEKKCFTRNLYFGFSVVKRSQLLDDKTQEQFKDQFVQILGGKIEELALEGKSEKKMEDFQLDVNLQKTLEEKWKHNNCNLNLGNFSKLKLCMKSLEHRSYDGSITWKIDSYTFKKEQTADKKGACLHSPISLTSKYGYQFCARVYLNGDGMGFGTHLSLYFVLMKSEFDNILEWPFSKTIEFSLINQENPSKTFIDAFTPPPESECCQKPEKAMNISVGCPMLMRHEHVENNGFLKDDSLLIKVRVLDPFSRQKNH